MCRGSVIGYGSTVGAHVVHGANLATSDANAFICIWLVPVPILGYVYSPFEVLPSYAFPTHYFFMPTLILLGLWMWKGHAVRNLFNRQS